MIIVKTPEGVLACIIEQGASINEMLQTVLNNLPQPENCFSDIHLEFQLLNNCGAARKSMRITIGQDEKIGTCKKRIETTLKLLLK